MPFELDAGVVEAQVSRCRCVDSGTGCRAEGEESEENFEHQILVGNSGANCYTRPLGDGGGACGELEDAVEDHARSAEAKEYDHQGHGEPGLECAPGGESV